jgi:hypothetical protein
VGRMMRKARDCLLLEFSSFVVKFEKFKVWRADSFVEMDLEKFLCESVWHALNQVSIGKNDSFPRQQNKVGFQKVKVSMIQRSCDRTLWGFYQWHSKLLLSLFLSTEKSMMKETTLLNHGRSFQSIWIHAWAI